MRKICSFLFLLNIDSEVYAHASNIIGQKWWQNWTFPPLVTSNLIIFSSLYFIGTSRTLVSNRRGNFFFICGTIVLILALLSPVDAYSDHLAFVHMVQHMLIMMVAAPFFVVASPSRKLVLAFPAPLRRIIWRWRRRLAKHPTLVNAFSHPLIIWVIFGVTLWVAHLPRLYEAALHNELLHDFQHLAFFVASYFFWLVLLNPLRTRRIPVGIGAIYLFVASLHTIILGAFMALSPNVWYPTYTKTTLAFQTSAEFDQQIAGYIMWMPSCMMYASIAIVLIYFHLISSKDSLHFGESS